MRPNTIRAIGFGTSVLTGPVMGCWFISISQILVTEYYARRCERSEMTAAALPYAIQALKTMEMARVEAARLNFRRAQARWERENVFASS